MAKVFRKGYRLEIIGQEAVNKRLAEIQIGIGTAFDKALRQEGETILSLAENNAPYDTGALYRSGKVKDGEEERNYTVAIGFGDESKNPKNDAMTGEYARYQHETNPNHAKFLENAFNDMQTGMPDRIATKIGAVK